MTHPVGLSSRGGHDPFRGFRFVVFTNDHEPAHVHVFGVGHLKIDAALARGRTDAMEEPRVASVRYEPSSRRVILELANACTFAFPPELAQGLETAADDQLAGIEILGGGYGLHWPALDVDLSVPHLLAGLFGTAFFMARRAGRATSPAKADAARANGAKGGRPKRAAGV